MPIFISNLNLGAKATSIVEDVIKDSNSSNITIEESKEKISNSVNFKIVKQLGFDRFSKNYTNSEPQILFVAEYKFDSKFFGVLLVFEKFFESTHYEVFKRNLFSDNQSFERVLFLDSKNLELERKNYIHYIKNILGFSNIDENTIFIFHDDEIKEDRIYEYKIKASFIPRNSDEVDYDSILESKNLLKTLKFNGSDASIFDFSSFIMGSKDLAWILSLLNEKLDYFGKVATLPIKNIISIGETLFVPSNIGDVLKVINDSILLFGLKNTVKKLIQLIGDLDTTIVNVIMNSINENNLSFSWDNSKAELLKQYPSISSFFKSASSSVSDEIKKVVDFSSIIKTGVLSLVSIEDYTTLFNYIREIIDILLLAQENSLEKDELKEQANENLLQQVTSNMQNILTNEQVDTKTESKKVVLW